MPEYESASAARAAVVEAALGEIGKTDPRRYWSAVSTHSEPWSAEWSGPFALWSLRTAGLVEWPWHEGSGFLYRLVEIVAPSLRSLVPADCVYLSQLERHALVVDTSSDHALLVLGNGRAGRVTTIEASRSALLYVYTISTIANRYERRTP